MTPSAAARLLLPRPQSEARLCSCDPSGLARLITRCVMDPLVGTQPRSKCAAPFSGYAKPAGLRPTDLTLLPYGIPLVQQLCRSSLSSLTWLTLTCQLGCASPHVWAAGALGDGPHSRATWSLGACRQPQTRPSWPCATGSWPVWSSALMPRHDAGRVQTLERRHARACAARRAAGALGAALRDQAPGGRSEARAQVRDRHLAPAAAECEGVMTALTPTLA